MDSNDENEKKRPKYKVQLKKNKKLSHKHCKESRLRKTKPIKKHNFQKFIAVNMEELKESKKQKDTRMDQENPLTDQELSQIEILLHSRLSDIYPFPVDKIEKLIKKLKDQTAIDEIVKQKIIKLTRMKKIILVSGELEKDQELVRIFVQEKLQNIVNNSPNEEEYQKIQHIDQRYQEYREQKNQLMQENDLNQHFFRIQELRENMNQLKEMMVAYQTSNEISLQSQFEE